MKYTCYLLFLVSLLSSGGIRADERCYDYIFFDNSLMKGNYFYTQATYTSPSWIKQASHHLPVTESAWSTPGNALELTYISAPGGNWYSEIQYAPVRGNDFFRPAERLSLQVRWEEETDIASLPEIAIRLADSTYTRYVNLHPYLTDTRLSTWHTLSIPLEDFGIGKLSNENIKSFAAVAFRPGAADRKLHTLYIDEVELLPAILPAVRTLTPPFLQEAKGYERHIDLAWTPANKEEIKYYRIYRSFDNQQFQPVAIRRPWMHRYTDFLGETGCTAFYKMTAVDYAGNESALSTVVSATTRPLTDEELMDMVQEAHFRYYWEGAEPNSGLARENIPGRTDMIATGASGFGIMALITGIERGFISRAEGIERLDKITSFLEKADTYHGAFPHFIDGTTGRTEPFFGHKDNGGDLVETSFLFQGLLAARQYCDRETPAEKRIRTRIDRLWKGVEWDWYTQYENSPYLYWHWSPDQAWTINHRLIGWNETMITYLLAIMSPTHPVAPQLYYSGWASQDSIAQAYRSAWGKTDDGSWYTNGNTYYGEKLPVGVSNGGPLFFIHYSYMGLDPHRWTDRYTRYFENNRKIALINLRYCIENPGRFPGYGEDCWGLTASDFTWNYQAQEPVLRLDNGTIAPTGALASFPYTPEASLKALKNYYRTYGSFLWGEYGFRDAFNLSVNWCSPLFMGLNQAPITVMIENYRSGLLWNLFMSHPDVQKGLDKLRALSSAPDTAPPSSSQTGGCE